MDKLQVINSALSLVGSKVLGSLTENTDTRKKAVPLFDVAKEEVFDLPQDWRFATARKQLARRTETPDLGFSYMFNLPDANRRIISMVDPSGDVVEYEWAREVYISGKTQYDVIVTDQTSCYIKYIVLRDNVGVWPAWFAKVVYHNLAFLLSEPLKKSEQKAANLFKTYEIAKLEAYDANDIEIGRVSDKNVRLEKGNTDVIDEAWGLESTNNCNVIRVVE